MGTRARAGAGIFCILIGLLILPGNSARGATLVWGLQNNDMGTLSVDSSNFIYTGTGNNQGTGALSRYSGNTGAFFSRKSYSDTTIIPRTATAVGPGPAVYGVGSHSGGFIHTVRFDPVTGNVLWNRNIANAGPSNATANGSGVLVSGGTTASLDATNQGSDDGYAAKYDTDGNLQWQIQFGGNSSDGIWGVVMDLSGNSYYVGDTFGAITSPNPGTPHVGGTPSDAYIMSYDNAGNFRWGRQFGNTTGDSLQGVTVDPSGNVIVAGFTHDTLFGPRLGAAGKADIIVRKYDTNGNVIWSKQMGGPSDDRARAVATDAAGNIYIGAETFNNLARTIGPSQFGDAASDALVAMLDPNGNFKWWYQAGSDEQETVSAIAVGPNGNVYVAGDSNGVMFPGGVNDAHYIFAVIPEPASACLIAGPLSAMLLRRRHAHRRA